MISEHTLDNGLKVVLVQDPGASLVSVRTYVRAGSIDEDPLLGSGLSHYLEHLVAGGTTTVHPEESYRRTIAKLGGAAGNEAAHQETKRELDAIKQLLKE